MPASAHASTPLTDAALVAHFAAGEKATACDCLGVEHEKIGVLAGGAAPAYDTHIGPLLERLEAGGRWKARHEAGYTIALDGVGEMAGASVTLEPGGQFELSDAPRRSASEAKAAIEGHLRELARPAAELGIRFLGVGFRPFGTRADVPWMPKGRYRVMREYLPTRGARSLEMMQRTATVQANLDYASQPDCADKLRTAMGVSSLVTALWAASPVVDGRATDWQSYRAACWLETDPDRCGLLPFVFAPSAPETLYRDYAEWALDVPMFFVHRGDDYRFAGIPFRRFLAEGWGGERATVADWELHLSTLFPEVRLKQYLEFRGADAGALPMIYALGALVRGLLYDPEARAAAWSLVADWSFAERQALRHEVPLRGLRATVRGREIGALAPALVDYARAGLQRLGAQSDVPLLDPVAEIARTGRTTADDVRALFQDEPDVERRIARLSLALA